MFCFRDHLHVAALPKIAVVANFKHAPSRSTVNLPTPPDYDTQAKDERSHGFPVARPYYKSGMDGMSLTALSTAVSARSTSPAIVSHISAMTALLSRVIENTELVNACMAYQDGLKMALYEDGDVAACNGHLSLLRLRCSLRPKGERSKGGDGSSSCSSSTTSSTRSVEERTGGSPEEEAEGGKQVSMVTEEGHTDGNEGDAMQDESVRLLEDLRFTHLAADWAAAQGHLAVVRSASQSTC